MDNTCCIEYQYLTMQCCVRSQFLKHKIVISYITDTVVKLNSLPHFIVIAALITYW